MPGATCRSRPQAAAEASAVRVGTRAVSSSERPVSGRGRPPSPSSESSTIFVVFDTTSGRMRSSMISVYRRVLRLLDRVLQRAELVDLHTAHVARLHEHRARLHPETDAGRRSRRDEVTGGERHEPGEVADEIAHVEDEGLRVAPLHLLTIHERPQLEAVRIGNLLAVGDVGADGCRRLEDLAGHPLGGEELEIARARIVDDCVAPYVIQRRLLRHEARGTTDHDPQLDLPVELLAPAWAQDRIPGADECVVPLGEGRLIVWT